MVRARHEGSRFDTDVFLADQGLLPVETARAAHVVSTRFEPELYVPPDRATRSSRAPAAARDEALYFDTMEERLVAGRRARRLPIYIDLAFLDGRRGAHVNISGVSGVATKTTLRELPALRALPLRRARRRGGQHQGADLQRQGRGPAVPRQAQRAADRRATAPTTRRSGCRPGRSSRSGSGRPSSAGRTSRCPTPAAATSA